MKKAHDKYYESGEEYEYPKTQRQKPGAAERRNFSKSDSSGYRKDYYPDENRPVRYPKHSYQVERKSRTHANRNDQDYDLEKQECDISPPTEHQYLNEPEKSTEKSSIKENYKKFQRYVLPFPPNKGNVYPPSKNQGFKNIPEKTERKGKFKDEVSLVNDAEVFNTGGDCDNISFIEEKCSKNLDVRDTDFVKSTGIENSLPLNQEPIMSSYESNQPSQYYYKQNNVQSNANFHNLCTNNVYNHEERPDLQSDNNIKPNSSQRAIFLGDSAPYKDMGFNMLRLTDLLYYNVNLMEVDQLSEYASAVKYKILDKIDKFPYPEKDELEFLCEITDGDQSEKNQKIITTRACRIVKNATEKYPLLFNALETLPPPPPPPPSQIIVYQTVPNLPGITNRYCSSYEHPVKNVQNSEVLTSSANYKVPGYNVAQNGNYVTSREVSDSNKIQSSSNYRAHCGIQNSNPNDMPEEISDSYDIQSSNGYRETCGVKNSNTNNNTSEEISNSSNICSSNGHRGNYEAQISNTNNSPVSPVARGNKDLKSSQHRNPSVLNEGESKTISKIFFDEEKSLFFPFKLNNLLKYDVNSMHGEMVFDYAFSMKQRVLENISNFPEPYKEKLKFLCEITDGTQIEQNQKLINARMCELIESAYYELSKRNLDAKRR